MSAIDNILLRITANPPMIAPKGSVLTYAELDNNFILIFNALKAMGSGANLSPYNAGTVYDNTIPTYVSYGGSIWQYVNAAPTAGVTPGTDIAYWVEVTIGSLAHVQNTDLYLNQGGAYEVTASSIFNHLNGLTRTVTEMQGLAGSYVPGQDYFVTDPGVVAHGQFLAGGFVKVTAISATILKKSATAYLKNAAMAAFGNFEVLYDVTNDWFSEVVHEAGSIARQSLGSTYTTIKYFPFDDGISVDSIVEDCIIPNNCGVIYKTIIKRDASITLDVTAALAFSVLEEYSVYNGAVGSIGNSMYLERGAILLNSCVSEIFNVFQREGSQLEVVNTCDIIRIEIESRTKIKIEDSTARYLKFGTGMNLLIDNISCLGDSTYHDVIERNNNTLVNGSTVTAAEPLDLTDQEMCGIIVVSGADQTIDNITPPVNVYDYWDIEIRPGTGIKLTINDSSVNAGNIKVLRHTANYPSPEVQGTNRDSICLRWNPAASMYFQTRDLIRA